MNDITSRFNQKRILIWGYGREGKSSEAFLQNHCHPLSVEIFEGKRDGFNLNNYDFVFKSPGIYCEEEDERIIAQSDLFMEAFGQRVIGVTGSKGKSTTSSLIYTILKQCRPYPSVLVGNIGYPCLDAYEQMLDENCIAVFEISCHQLAHIKTSPHIAVFLNLYEEHLDYYKTLEHYGAAKANITLYQSENDYFYYGEDVPYIDTKAQKILIHKNEGIRHDLRILGEHNRFNAEFAYRIAVDRFHLNPQEVENSLTSFEGLPHRLKYIGEKNGISFYDDSISTIPEATIQAVHSIPDVKSVIIGGMDRGIDYSKLIDFIQKRNDILFILAYASGKRIYDALKPSEHVVMVDDLDQAVPLALQQTPSGSSCVLSPAAASYGYFKNFEERGDYYKSLLESL